MQPGVACMLLKTTEESAPEAERSNSYLVPPNRTANRWTWGVSRLSDRQRWPETKSKLQN